MENVKFISVILPLRLEWEPCYSVASDEGVMIGDRVKVLFANRTYTGVISAVGITPETDVARIRPVLAVARDLERILPQEIELWRAVSEYYLCSIGEVYKAAYPLGKTGLEEARAESRRKAEERESRAKENAVARLEARKERLSERLDRKILQIERSRKESSREAYINEKNAIIAELDAVNAALSEMSSGPNETVRKSDETTKERPILDMPQLSEHQEKAYDETKTAFNQGKPVLLHGVTGSGKTEVYIRLAHDTLSAGRNVLYLVPEIALSRQLEERLRRTFGGLLMVFHSGETAADRRDMAERVRGGNGYVVLGTRSSLFLPHHDLGLIIVDEEHDNSYKQDSPAPRYNGRDTALMLNRIARKTAPCDIILGSATPSLEELYNCQVGRHALIRMTERFHGSADSEIEIIDTKAERRKNGMTGNFSRRLIGHISRTLAAGEQVLILRSRRALSPSLQCEQCGDIPKCPHCNVSLSLHKDNTLRCHYCGHRSHYDGRCGRCGGTLRSLGAGTQKIEEEVAALFPDARTARLDSDSAQNRNYEKNTIRDFSNGEIDILIGTQIISKGFDFSNLTLVAVIAADSMLGIQDFRADERAMQLLEQLRGRCGRRARQGLFVLQTSQQEHPVYQNIVTKSPAFGSYLLQERKDFNFPPYTRIVEITVRDRNADRAEMMAYALASEIRGARPAAEGLLNDPVTGPYAPVIDRIADMHIRTIRVALKKNRQLSDEKAALKNIVGRFEKSRKYEGHIVINVDPS